MKNQKGLLTIVLFSLLFVWQAAAFTIEDRVQCTANLNVRSTPSTSGSLVTTESSGSRGIIIDGPQSANGFTWWRITWDNGYTGWSVQDYLTPVTWYLLSIASSNPNSGVSISVSPNDFLHAGSGSTFFSRFYDSGTSVTLTAPSTASGNNFSKWTRNGVDYSVSPAVNLTVQATYTMTAVYVGPPPVTHTLTVASSNPNSGVGVTGNQTDNNGNYGGVTTFTRVFNHNASVSFNAASTAGGNNFQKWQRDGLDLTTSTTAFVTMDANHTITAVYTAPSPTVQTLVASSVGTTSATLNGYCDSHGAVGTVYFQYGLTASYGSSSPLGDLGPPAGNVSYGLSGLTPNTIYHFRVVATANGGTSYGSDLTFQTSAQAAPTVQTLAASSVGITSATLNGYCDSHGAVGTVYFQYGLTASYGSASPLGDLGPPAGNVSYNLTGLSPNTPYHFRVVASTSGGTSYGADLTFTTPPVVQPGPIVQTLAASSQTANAAQLNAFVNPNGLSTTAYFQYGTTTSYGSTTPSGNFGTTPQNIGHNITGLTPSTIHHFRIVAYNSAGTSYGLDSSFVTTSAPGSTPPTIVTQPQSQTVQTGVNVTFTVGVSGTTPLSYQWLRNGVAMAGKTSASMTLNSVGTFDSDGYSVVATNSFGKKTSATAWLAVYSAPTNSPPPPPIVVQTNRSPENPNLIPVTGTQLKVFSNGVFTNGTIDLTKMTVVFTHGWNSNPDVWARAMASNMVASAATNANFIAWDWRSNAASTIDHPVRPFTRPPAEGQLLGQSLANVLGVNYGKPIHFIGHSLGTLVNAAAANYLHERTGGAFDWQKTHMTLLDDAEIAEVGGAFVRVGPTVPGLEKLFGQTETSTVGWVSPIPNHSSWVDSYMSLVGWPRTTTVNVWLNQGIDLADRSNPIQFLQDAHGYAYKWYGETTFQPNLSILGNRYSFERLGFSTQPGQACPYPPASLFVQDTYPFGEYALHEPSPLEFPLMVIRNLAMFATYGRLSAVNLLNGTGQKTGDAYVDVQVSAAPAVSDTTSSIVSDFFYSLRTVLNSSSGSQTLFVARGGPTPQDAGGGSEPPCVWLPIVVPSNAVVLSFDFTFTGGPGSDVLTANIDGTNVFALEAEFIPQNQKLNSGSIPVVGWAGKSVELFLGLVGGSSSNATVTIDAMRFYEFAPPSLAITASGSQVVISWPISAQDYALESADSLTGTNQWSVVTNTRATNGLSLQVTNSVSGNAKFYRLKK